MMLTDSFGSISRELKLVIKEIKDPSGVLSLVNRII